ncbi:MAG: hypothetical protein HYZ53_20510 [Planctomycetes bacterium]|nr:hypothetical protein [Planctomycetota bacterium]
MPELTPARVCACAVALLLAGAPAWADVILLKDGRRLEGKLTDKGLQLEVKTKDGLVLVDKKEIAELQVAGTPADGEGGDGTAKQAEPAPAPAPGAGAAAAPGAAPGPAPGPSPAKPPETRMGKANQVRDGLRSSNEETKIAALGEVGAGKFDEMAPDVVRILQAAPTEPVSAAARGALLKLDPMRAVAELAKVVRPSPSAAILAAAPPVCQAARTKEAAELLATIWFGKYGPASDRAREAMKAMRGPAILVVASKLLALDCGQFTYLDSRAFLIAFLKECPSRDRTALLALRKNIDSANMGCGLQDQAVEALVAMGNCVIPMMLDALANGDGTAAAKAQQVLQKVTGQNFHARDQKSWLAWWASNRKRIEDELKAQEADEKKKADEEAKAAEAKRKGGGGEAK